MNVDELTRPSSVRVQRPNTPERRSLPSFRQRVAVWLWQSEQLASLRSACLLAATRAAFLNLARASLQNADRALESDDPAFTGANTSVAVFLYREAARFALFAQFGESRAPLSELIGELEAPLKAELGSEFDAAVRAVHQDSGVATVLAALEVQQLEARLSARLVRALLAEVERPKQAYAQALRARAARLSAVTAGTLLALVLCLAVVKYALTPANLAEGKPWRASSAYSGFDPRSHTCDGRRTRILFHTDEEENPWFQHDLLRKVRFNRVNVKNRDEFQARAVPLVLEISDDGQSFQEVAVMNRPFVIWKADLGDVEARYVRLRVPNKTWLHLESVTVQMRQDLSW